MARIDPNDRFSRRDFLKKTARTVAAATVAGPLLSHVSSRPAKSQSRPGRLTISWLGWEHYDIPELTRGFEEEYGISVRVGYFDENVDAFNRLRLGGTEDFDLVMFDGFWPELAYEHGLIQEIDYSRLSNLRYAHPDFVPPKQRIFEVNGKMIAAPNCWGGYGVTYNTEMIKPYSVNPYTGNHDERLSIYALYDPNYRRRISVSIRSQENIALTGILIGASNPWAMTDKELEECKRLLIQQKREALLTYWHSVDDLERLFRARAVWAGPEWSGVYRRLYMDGLPYHHELLLQEGGLGWIDTWCITSGVRDPEKLDACYKWIDYRLRPENMALVAERIGWSPTIDVRNLISPKLAEALFQHETHRIHSLIQFQTPDRPEVWRELWDEVLAS